mgnify:CR=1 FL=1
MRQLNLTHTYRPRSPARALSRVHPCFPPSVHGEAEVVVPARLPQLREVGVAVAQHAVHRGVALLDGEPRRVAERARRGATRPQLARSRYVAMSPGTASGAPAPRGSPRARTTRTAAT